ncbi:MAG: hypothetical protein GXW89_08765 [Phycisphaerae bacterium]|nr:hypothetical protein [Phycisphaerae bacterium]
MSKALFPSRRSGRFTRLALQALLPLALAGGLMLVQGGECQPTNPPANNDLNQGDQTSDDTTDGGNKGPDTGNPPRTELFIASDFEAGDDGWVVNDGEIAATYSSTAGSPGGHISSQGDNTWYWTAPAKFLGNLSNAYGRTLEFDVNHEIPNDNPNCLSAEGLVVLSGEGLSIYANGPYRPEATWTRYVFRLDETADWRNSADHERVTAAQMQQVLSNVTSLRIRGNCLVNCFRSVVSGLDNVVLNLADNPPPRPAEPIVTSTFDTDAEGWAVAGGPFGRSGALSWATDAAAGGHLVAAENGTWYWLAPRKFVGDVSAAYGKTLQFNLNHDVPNNNYNCLGVEKLVILNGGGHNIYHNGGYKPGEAWTHYLIRLDEQAEWRHVGDDRRVTQDEMRAVLANLGQLKIRGGFLRTCFGDRNAGGLDNVRLDLSDSPPLPLPGPRVVSDFEIDAEGWAVAGNGLADPARWSGERMPRPAGIWPRRRMASGTGWPPPSSTETPCRPMERRSILSYAMTCPTVI